jgi:hypothetical protein
MPIVDYALRLGAALLLGACVGLERQWRQRMAGTRTNALVSAGSVAQRSANCLLRCIGSRSPWLPGAVTAPDALVRLAWRPSILMELTKPEQGLGPRARAPTPPKRQRHHQLL